MTGRENALRRLAAGDIFHAESPNGASLICLVTAVTESTIHAKRITTQEQLRFDRRTGEARLGPEQVVCTIDSTAPLPVETHNVMLGIERKFRLEQDRERLKLNDAEKHALLFVDSHYRSNRL